MADVRVLLFAALRELAGARELSLDARASATVADLVSELVSRYGEEFGRVLDAGSVLVDGERAGPEDRLREGAEVALLPPVSGG